MTQELSLARRAAAALALPFVVALVIPTLIVTQTQTFDAPSLLAFVIGTGFITAGLILLFMTVTMFRSIGQGTLVPWDPTQHLVVVGVYRYVRNPMISGVGAILLGETILCGSLPLLIWTGLFAIINLIYIPLSEEPGLRQRFGADYDEYARHVPRWIPRRTPWIKEIQ